ncbi:MAG: UDP-N-acetylglucosamine 2-epimerase (non-hydrolyzing) [Caldilineales bacterium]|nr:UDP-N-acetylglucosamine 2-epimerase (non-hydrolyzing) [Caldilineales bacterium]
MLEILHVVGARPNFMKAAPVMRALAGYGHVRQTLVHTGQHYDANMSDVFFAQLGLPEPTVNLGVGSGSHAVQTAQIMLRFEAVVAGQRPDWVVVYGDVNSTVAVALVCAKRLIPVAHVEAGLRSFDRTMPEEINRVLTDQIADLLFTPSADGDANLLREGVAATKIHRVGNVMIDTLVRLLPAAATCWETERLRPWQDRPYALVTLHRPANVDDPTMLGGLLSALAAIGRRLPVLFPVHPRTRQRLEDFGLGTAWPGLHLLEPLSYLEFLALQTRATLVITDSGGIQEETTYLGIPCLTVRDNTERPITVDMGTNILVGRDPARLQAEAYRILDGDVKTGCVPPLWDGRAGERVAAILARS